MAKNRSTIKKIASSSNSASTQPKFPYSTKPNSLRKFLELVPQKPKPPKVNADTLRAWELRDTNDRTIIRVLKALGFVSSNNTPTQRYTEFMTPGTGPGVLAEAIKEVWPPLFNHSHEPHKEEEAKLRNYFNIHSGGTHHTIGFQMQTFKAACDHADFSVGSQPRGSTATRTITKQTTRTTNGGSSSSGEPTIHIDLHIHLPENKSRRDYECIFEDIARHIFGRDLGGGPSD